MAVLSGLVAAVTLLSACTTQRGVLIVQAPRTQAPPTVKNLEFLDQYAATYRFSLGRPVAIQVTPNDKSVLFLRASGPRSFVQDLWIFDIATGQERVLLTAEQILGGGQEKLTPEELARRERMRSASRGIASYAISKDGSKVVVPLSGRLFVIDLAAAQAGTPKVQELKSDAGFPIDPRLSPDGASLACVRNGEIYITDLATGNEHKLTSGAGGAITNGLAEFVAQEEMDRFAGYWWSPDGNAMVYQRTDTSPEETFYIADPVHPENEPNPWPYPRAGKANAKVSLWLTPVRGAAKPTEVAWDHDAFPYLARVGWPEHGKLTILVQNRTQTEQVLYSVDPASGATQELLREKDDAWINLAGEPRWLDDGTKFLWMTEQAQGTDDWQLQLRSAAGEVVRTLKIPGVAISGIVDVNEKMGTVRVAASAEPTEGHVMEITLDGELPKDSAITLATRAPGVHGATFGRGHGAWVHGFSLADGTIGNEVYRADGTKAGELRSIAEEPSIAPKVSFYTLGDLGFRAAVVLPRDFDPTKKYPVLNSVYGGPHVQTVRASSRNFLLQQWQADQGFIVVSIDARGTPARGRAWERTIKNDVMSLPLADQAAAMSLLSAKVPQMDLSRAGITGWSFGGYFSAMATMRRPDVFKAGVAGAPVCDWRDYDTHYTERYMGLPDENAAGYDKASVLTYCKDLTVPLLIIHGTADDNVYFLHSLKMTGSLFRAGRQFEFLPLAGFTHSVPDPVVIKGLQTRIVEFFETHLGGPR
jgi:dipeptidyl-peptidase-4